MTIHEIVMDKFSVLQMLIEPIREQLFKELDNDIKYELSTDEITELIDDMVIAYLKLPPTINYNK